MIREFRLADLITLANGFAGFGSVLCVMQYLVSNDRRPLWTAFALLPVALACDIADGRVARWQKRVSILGQELDSLADLVSFGVAPAVLGFALGLRGTWDAVILVYFVACGISRLARYNATAASLSDDTGKVRYFEGTPIPSTLLIVAVMAWLTHAGRIGANLPGGAWSLGPWTLHAFSLVFAASGSAMISKTLHIPKP